ncbi:hypothetical protein NCAS_0A11610 [Naumovozyma castellii]|uniref:Uncharacterized protein n=1 Tax=Naumovozyma castellii TaxID=27288 RepID=G0V8C1_NAUCA|nr:hypothetical protein NCAS_0A11610 [Naumovozyma castellii CBS 4309]CCC67719.1 hypothetical protein NCAS_0A11610 [Naumovozyma castellii CBS 4309]
MPVHDQIKTGEENTEQVKSTRKEFGKVKETPRSTTRYPLNEVIVNNHLIETTRSNEVAIQKPIQRFRREESDMTYIRLKKRRVYDDRKSIETDRNQEQKVVLGRNTDNLKTNSKPEKWKDLDKAELNDISMVAEYSSSIFEYLYRRELETLPSHNYLLERSSKYHIRPSMRAILVDWLVEVHEKFQCYPETLFLSINIMDRFLSKNKVSTNKLQLLAVTSLFIAAKFEEVRLPKLADYAYITDGAASKSDIRNAEMYMLTSLNFDLGWPSPMGFLRRISKADSYHFETRNIGKFLLEVATCSHLFVSLKPSLLSCMAMYTARRITNTDDILWNETFKHYSGGIDPLHDQSFQALCRDLVKEVSHPQTKLEGLALKFKKPIFGSLFSKVHQWCDMQVSDNFSKLFTE